MEALGAEHAGQGDVCWRVFWRNETAQVEAHLKAFEQTLVAGQAWEEQSLPMSLVVQNAMWAPERWRQCCGGEIWALQEKDGEEGQRVCRARAGAAARCGVTRGSV